MAQLHEEFSIETLPAPSSGDFSPIPDGWYVVRVVKADLTDTKAGTGQYIKMRLDVVGPSYQGRVLFSNINIRNPSVKAEEIGKGQLSAIMTALGLAKISDTDQLIGGEMQVKVETKQDDTYGASNEVKAYKGVGGDTPAPAKPAAVAPAAPAKAAPPWSRK